MAKLLTEGIRVNVTAEQRAELEMIAQRDDRSVAAVVRRYIREGLEREAAKVVAA